MKVWWYTIHYNEKKDYFFGMVESKIGAKANIIYTIDDTKDIVKLIKDGRMNHIDDVAGLSNFLRESEVIGKQDIVLMNKEPLIW